MASLPGIAVIGPPAFFAQLNVDSITTLADQQISQANAHMQTLVNVVGGLAPPFVGVGFPAIDNAPILNTITPPTLDVVVWEEPTFPTAFSETLDISSVLPAAFEETAPELNYPAIPAEFSETTPASPSVGLTYVDPGLTVDLPVAPDLLDISIPAFGGLTLPTWSETIPELNEPTPNITNYTSGSYASTLLTTLQSTLSDRITTGGTGLSVDAENAIWDSARDKEYRAQAAALADLDRMETLGYALPSGVWLDARLKIQTETDYTITTISREIAIEQARLEQTNVLKALEEVRGLENILIDSFNQTETRALEAAKYATDAGVAIYNAKVAAFTSTVEAYRARVQIYEAQIRGALAEVEAYKAQVDAEQAKAQTNVAVVQSYKVQVDAALSDIEVYKAQIEGIRTQAEIEKLRIDIYGEEIRAYVSRVQAYTARVEAYRTSVQAEGNKQEVFRSQVAAYSAQVEAGTKQADAQIEAFKGRINAKQAEYDGYRAAVQGQTSRAEGIAARNQSTTQLFTAEVGGQSAYNDALTKQWEANIDLTAKIAEVNVQAAKANADLYLAAKQIAIESSKTAAQVSAQLGAAALNAVNFSNSASISHSNVASAATSASDTSSSSTSDVTSNTENYNYNASI